MSDKTEYVSITGCDLCITNGPVSSFDQVGQYKLCTACAADLDEVENKEETVKRIIEQRTYDRLHD